MPPSLEGNYFIARGEAASSSIFDTSGERRSGDVAAIRSIPQGAPPAAMWNTCFWVDSADEAASKVRDAGGGVVAEPFDFLNACRMAVFTDPEGRRSLSGRHGSTRARGWSTTRAQWCSTASTLVTWKATTRCHDFAPGRKSLATTRTGLTPAGDDELVIRS